MTIVFTDIQVNDILNFEGNIKYENKSATATSAISTTSSSFVDIDSMTINVDGNNKKYLINFTGEIYTSSLNKMSSFRVVVDGTEETNSLLEVFTNNTDPADGYVIVTLQYTTASTVDNPVVIKIQWKTVGGVTLNMRKRNLSIQELNS